MRLKLISSWVKRCTMYLNKILNYIKLFPSVVMSHESVRLTCTASCIKFFSSISNPNSIARWQCQDYSFCNHKNRIELMRMSSAVKNLNPSFVRKWDFYYVSRLHANKNIPGFETHPSRCNLIYYKFREIMLIIWMTWS